MALNQPPGKELSDPGGSKGRPRKENHLSMIDEEFPSESLSRSLFRSVGMWAVAEAALVCSLRREDLPGRTCMARPARLAWLLSSYKRKSVWRYIKDVKHMEVKL